MLFDDADRQLFRRIWVLTWPMMVSNTLEMSVGMIDLLLVRPFGPSATLAIGASRQVTFLIEAMVLAVSSSVLTLVSQSIGAQAGGRKPPDDDTPMSRSGSTEEIVRQGIFLVLLLGIPTALAGYFLSRPIVLGLQLRDDALGHGEAYLRWYFIGVIFSWGNAVAAAIFRGAGDFRTPLRLTLGMTLLHVGFSYALIHGAAGIPSFGVQGAAMGMLLARGCGLLLFLALLVYGNGPVRVPAPRLSHLYLHWPVIEAMLRIGVPAALANVLRHGSRLVFLGVVGGSTLGLTLHAAVGVGLQLRLLGILPALAFQISSATLVGQALGRGDLADAMTLGRRSVQLLAVLMMAITLGMILLADPIANLFVASPDTASLAAHVLRWFAVAQLFSALSIGLQGALLGAGDTMPAMRYTALSEWCLLLPASYVCVFFNWVPDGLLAVWTLAPALSYLLMQRHFGSGRWLTGAGAAGDR